MDCSESVHYSLDSFVVASTDMQTIIAASAPRDVIGAQRLSVTRATAIARWLPSQPLEHIEMPSTGCCCIE